MVNFVSPTVTSLIGVYTTGIDPRMSLGEFSTDREDLIEFAGRACYQSFDKPNPATRDNRDYIANIIEQGHESVLEHASATFYITGVSRALTHELIRHRHLSFSQLSQRYVSEEDANFVIPPAIEVLVDSSSKEFAKFEKHCERSLKRYAELVETLEDKGLPRKQAREAARGVLPNCIETRIVVSGNLRAWRDFLKKRYHPAADVEIRKVAGLLLEELVEMAPSVFADIAEV